MRNEERGRLCPAYQYFGKRALSASTRTVSTLDENRSSGLHFREDDNKA